MFGIDWIIIIVAAIIITIQTYRGAHDIDYVLFEMIGFIAAATLSMRWYVRFSESVAVSEPLALLFLFVISSIIFLLLAGFIARFAGFSLAPLDPYLGFIMGLVSAWVVLYVLLRVMQLFYPNGLSLNLSMFNKPIIIFDSMDNSPIAKEILNFNAFKAVMHFLNTLKTN